MNKITDYDAVKWTHLFVDPAFSFAEKCIILSERTGISAWFKGKYRILIADGSVVNVRSYEDFYSSTTICKRINE